MTLAAATRTSLAFAALLAATALAHTRPKAPAPVPAATPASAASAASLPLSDACPAQLQVGQTVSETIAGWTPLNQQGSYPFVRVAFHPGSPAGASLVVPTVEYKSQTGLHDGWDLPRRTGGYAVTCAYANTTATLSRMLADDVDFCQADYDRRFLTLVVKHWSCGAKRLMPQRGGSRSSARQLARPPDNASIKHVD
jgi:hypothetical protein